MDTAARLADLATPTLFEASPAVHSLDTTITPLFRPIHLCAPAATVQAAPGDNLAIHRALYEVEAGSVLVVSTGADGRHGFWGEVMLAAALERGLAGLVIDGGVRDTGALRAARFPVFAGGIALTGTGKSWPGRVNVPVVIGGALVRPGDIMVGDDDGVVVVAREHALDAEEKARARVEKETAIIERLRRGESTIDLLGLRPLLESNDG